MPDIYAVKDDYDSAYGTWESSTGPVPVASQFRVAWRTMADTAGYRTTYPALIPCGSFHVDLMMSAADVETPLNTIVAGYHLSSLLADFHARSTVGKHLRGAVIGGFPLGDFRNVEEGVLLYLRLNCLTSAYAPLWEEITGEQWTPEVALRNARKRRHAQNQIDAIVALSLGVTAEELCMIYRTQFPVMRRYDREDHFDVNGRKVPKEILASWKKLGDGLELSEADRTWIHPQSGHTYVFELPFSPLDRETELREAYAFYADETSTQE